jgi:hypothetical protein
MPTLSIHVYGIDELFRRLDRMAANDVLEAPMRAGLLDLENYMKDYPATQSRKPNPGTFVSDRQRRYVMAAIRDGRITVPYKRTGKLGQSWTWEITRHSNGLTGKIGTNLRYAPLVQSHSRQARMHSGNWRTDVMAIEARRAAIIDRFRRAVLAALR